MPVRRTPAVLSLHNSLLQFVWMRFESSLQNFLIIHLPSFNVSVIPSLKFCFYFDRDRREIYFGGKYLVFVILKYRCQREERKPTRCNNIDDLLSIVDVDY